jgi:hypothetical protein
MSTLRKSALTLALLGNTLFLTTPSFAVEPDVDSAAGPELPAPRVRPDFQTDDQPGASKLVPQVEVGEAPAVIVPDITEPVPPPPDYVPE